MRTSALSLLTYTVSEASSVGVSALVRDAEEGNEVVVARWHKPIAAVIGMRRFERLQEAERDLRDIGLVLTRAATDTGARVGLDEVFAEFGFSIENLEKELDEDLAAGRE
jgi:antitoxin (DNA-binding transcriptional repressor) of toxin-antitoxin stability system